VGFFGCCEFEVVQLVVSPPFFPIQASQGEDASPHVWQGFLVKMVHDVLFKLVAVIHYHLVP
jgi:hypothetical protein